MKSALAVLFTFLLAIPAGSEAQVCRHDSGLFHIFTEVACDGRREHHDHKQGQDHHDHSHSHSGDHSQHQASNEHHEPCSHDIVTMDDEFAGSNGPVAISLPMVVGIIPRSEFIAFKEIENEDYYFTNILKRGPPGRESPCSHFASSIRLLI